MRVCGQKFSLQILSLWNFLGEMMNSWWLFFAITAYFTVYFASRRTKCGNITSIAFISPFNCPVTPIWQWNFIFLVFYIVMDKSKLFSRWEKSSLKYLTENPIRTIRETCRSNLIRKIPGNVSLVCWASGPRLSGPYLSGPLFFWAVSVVNFRPIWVMFRPKLKKFSKIEKFS